MDDDAAGAPEGGRVLSVGAIAGIYWTVGVIWIVLSDLALGTIRDDALDGAGWDIAKGVGFVTVTAGLLWGLLARRQGALDLERARSSALERRLADVARMDTVGRFAGGIAHDFNNLLAVMRGHVDLLRDVEAHDTDSIDAIDQALDRATALTDDLQTVGRRQRLDLVPTDLSEFVRERRSHLHGLLPAEVALDVDAGDGPLMVRVDPVRFEQVLLNLATNARDAMPDGGRLRIGVDGNTTRGVIEVSDTGRGMSDDELRHCFDPFFSTKPNGKGTGLGLALTYGLVRQCGGDIDVRSSPGHGSTFTISLPLATTPPAS